MEIEDNNIKEETERKNESKEKEDIYSKNLKDEINNNERSIDLNISLNFNNNKTQKETIVKEDINNNLKVKNPDTTYQNKSFNNKNNSNKENNFNKLEKLKNENPNYNKIYINNLDNENIGENHGTKFMKELNMKIISKPKFNEGEIKSDLLNSKLNELIESTKREHLNNLSLEKTYNEKIKKLDKVINFKVNEKKGIMNKFSSIGNNLNEIIDKRIPKIIRNKNNYNQKSYEDISKLKQKQLSNSAKRYNIMKKDIKVIKSKIILNSKIDKSITKENKFISNKSEELNAILKKLNANIIELKNEINQLKKIKSYHENFCDKKINKLKEEKEVLKNEKSNELNMIEINKNNQKIQLIKCKNNSYRLNKANSMKKLNIFSEDKVNNTYKKIIPLKKINPKNNLIINSYSSIIPNESNILPEILFSSQKLKKNESVAELSLRSLFSQNEKMVFEKYNLLPKNKIEYYEKKYENSIKQKNDSLQKIKALNNKYSILKLDISNKIKNNQKQINQFEKHINGIIVKIAINKTKINIKKKKVNDLINKENEMKNEFQRLSKINNELKDYLKIYENIQNLNQENENQIKIEESIKIIIKSNKSTDTEKYSKENKKDENKLFDQ